MLVSFNPILETISGSIDDFYDVVIQKKLTRCKEKEANNLLKAARSSIEGDTERSPASDIFDA